MVERAGAAWGGRGTRARRRKRAYTVASRAEGYHLALTVASALAPLTVEPAQTQDFANVFLGRWGEAAVVNGGGKG